MTHAAALAWSTDNCSVGRTLNVIGEKWTLLVLREVFQGVRRFDDMREHTGMPRQVLSDRLAHLVEEGVLRREGYREPGQRERQEYRLTDKGIALHPILLALMTWGDIYAADPDGPSMEVRHRDCGAKVSLVMECAEGHDHLAPRDVRSTPGPAARLRSA